MADILQALDEALGAGEDIEPIVGAFFRLAEQAPEGVRGQMLTSLEPRIARFDPAAAQSVALLAGALCEMGAPLEAFPPAIFERIDEMLAALDTSDDASELPEAFYVFERAAMACLARSPSLRRDLPAKPRLLAKLGRYQERYGFLGKMLNVLDDEPIVVVHPSTRRGYGARMTGVADNFQLHSLLLGALAGEGQGRIPGVVPSPLAIAAATDGDDPNAGTVQSDWQLGTWRALRAGGVIAGMEDTSAWIWNEGVPADIEPFEGARVILIGPSSIQRSWNAQRVFPAMRGGLSELRAMQSAEVDGLLTRIERAVGLA